MLPHDTCWKDEEDLIGPFYLFAVLCPKTSIQKRLFSVPGGETGSVVQLESCRYARVIIFPPPFLSRP